MSETKDFDHDGACSCAECEELDLREIRQASEPNDVAGHNHRYPPSRDDCPRCVKVRKILSEPKIVAECWTCATCGPFIKRFIEAAAVLELVPPRRIRNGLLLLGPKEAAECRAAGHDVRPIHKPDPTRCAEHIKNGAGWKEKL